MWFVSRLGAMLLQVCREVLGAAGIVFSTIVLALSPYTWKKTVRRELARQVVRSGIESLPLTLFIAALAGASVVAQIQLVTVQLGQADLPVSGLRIIVMIVRVLGPLLIAFIVVGRSGTGITAELSSMCARNEVRLIQSMGVEPTAYLVVPRVLGLMAAVFGLTVIFVVAAFFTGWLSGYMLTANPMRASIFADKMFEAMRAPDIWGVLGATLVSGLVAGAICCHEGLTTSGSTVDVPRAVGRSVVRSISAILVICAFFSVIEHVW